MVLLDSTEFIFQDEPSWEHLKHKEGALESVLGHSVT